ncbi:hypothetical protein GN958_ATG17684 [Phytophthora infestans]|uniref:Uncharacterized protein n=1 Tax=Phytophthora infestans TaxID=4787 RepID=A0A8S9TXE2_PHYIN|nr:hypothetical protein GN958_ATG17684 [Phytophthora infestans]
MATEVTTTEETPMTSEDVSGDKKLASGLAMAAIGVATADLTGGVVGAAVHAPRSKPIHGDGGSTDTTTEVTETTETVTSEDVRALAREDVSGDVTSSVAERGGYAVPSGCTSGVGTGSS